jgi:alcohol dehydrogenase
MKKAFLVKKGEVTVKDVPKPTIQKDDDVILKLVRASVCGSDLWFYRGIDPSTNDNSGHECIGIVEETGSAITTVKKGDFVVAPFTHGCGHCAACQAGFDGNCQTYSDLWSSDCQAEYVRYQHGQWALVKITVMGCWLHFKPYLMSCRLVTTLPVAPMFKKATLQL